MSSAVKLAVTDRPNREFLDQHSDTVFRDQDARRRGGTVPAIAMVELDTR
jgi:hypothetical protein